MSATNKVLSTPELLEAVLLKLPGQDVLLDQRVSTVWHDTISDSPSIQQKLFYKPLPTSSETFGKAPLLNPMIARLLLQEHKISIESRHRCHSAGVMCKYKSIPSTHEFLVSWEDKPGSTLDVGMADSGSWKEMLVVDPPCPLHFVMYIDGLSGEMHIDRAMSATLGELAEISKSRQRTYEARRCEREANESEWIMNLARLKRPVTARESSET